MPCFSGCLFIFPFKNSILYVTFPHTIKSGYCNALGQCVCICMLPFVFISVWLCDFICVWLCDFICVWLWVLVCMCVYLSMALWVDLYVTVCLYFRWLYFICHLCVFFLLFSIFHIRYKRNVFVCHNYFKDKNNVCFLWIYDIKLCLCQTN